MYKVSKTVTPVRLYETNFCKLLTLFPSLANYNCFNKRLNSQLDEKSVDKMFPCNDKTLNIKILTIHRYTATVRLYKTLPEHEHLKQVDMLLQVYFDAKIVEVIAFQGAKKLKKYDVYPNKNMYQTDEKKQLNFHLYEILKMSLNMLSRNCDKISMAY